MSLAVVLILSVAVSVQAFSTTRNHHHPQSSSSSSLTSSSILHDESTSNSDRESSANSVVGDVGATSDHEREQAIVVGGGPVGLSTALVLVNRGYDVSLFEATSTDEIKAFNPAMAYLYNINERGQAFTNMFPSSIHEKLVESSVASTDAGFMVASGDVKEEIKFPKLPNFGVTTPSYWIPRHKMTVLMWDAVDEHNKARGDNNLDVGKINYEQGVSCINVHPSSSPSNSNENDENLQSQSYLSCCEEQEQWRRKNSRGKISSWCGWHQVQSQRMSQRTYRTIRFVVALQGKEVQNQKMGQSCYWFEVEGTSSPDR